MTRKEKCILAIEKGFIYNLETGIITGVSGKIINSKTNGYINLSFWVGKKQYNLLSHQFAWYWVNKECVEQIDHINGNRIDNRITNLRAVTNQQNQWNRTTAKGYYWHKATKKWMSRIRLNNKNIYLGIFNTEDEAHKAYLKAKKVYHII